MHKYIITFWTILLLSACSVAPNTAMQQSSFAMSTTSISEKPIATSSSSSVHIYTADQALDATYASVTSGITFRYPSHYVDYNCGQIVQVKIEEIADYIHIIRSPLFSSDCTPVEADQALDSGQTSVIASIAATRVHSELELQKFIQRTLGNSCVISEKETSGNLVYVHLRSNKPPTDETFGSCSNVIVWDTKAHAAAFSELSNKNGGGYDWPSVVPISTASGEIENGYDFAIMQSVRYLPE